jgi:hypothetical protein
MSQAQRTEDRPWQLAQVRIKPDELRRWHKACERIDLTLSQALRRAMRQFLQEQEETPGAVPQERLR